MTGGETGVESPKKHTKEDQVTKQEVVSKRISRKGFVKGAAVGAAGAAAAAALASCAPAATPMPTVVPSEGAAPCPTCPPAQECATPWIPEQWDAEADVVVIGYGGAGASAALEANDAGAKVLILEKMPQGLEGGSSSVSSAGMAYPYDKELATDHLYALNMGDTPYPVTPRELCAAFIDTIDGLTDWLESRGVEFEPYGAHDNAAYFLTEDGVAGPESPHESGFDAVRPIGQGAGLFQTLAGLIDDKGIEVMYESPARELIQDPRTKEILGVHAIDASGQDIYVKAKRGVVMALGSIQNNPWLQGQFLQQGMRSYTVGGPGSEGDGIYMVQQVGACLWHTNSATSHDPGVLVPPELMTRPIKWELPFRVDFAKSAPKAGYIVVNKYGNRFTNVMLGMGGTKRGTMTGYLVDFSYFDGNAGDPSAKGEYTNLPSFLVFDEERRQASPIVRTGYGFADLKGLYKWSDDNSQEIENGLIIKADTIGDLATKLDIDPAGLEQTVTQYNAYCEAGEDPDFGRSPESLQPLVTPPFYGVELCCDYFTMSAGPKRNGEAQVVDRDDNPIPRLYAAGEFGGIIGAMCQWRTWMPEAVMVGGLAGRNAAAEEPWD
jgi:succinate dehydrogenase/fumarate reductase flavoprotein subunit